MKKVDVCTIADLRPAREDTAAWGQAIRERHQKHPCAQLDIDCAVVERLPAGLLAALPGADLVLRQRECRVRLVSLLPLARQAVAVLQLRHFTNIEAGDDRHGQLPFVATVADQGVVLTLSRDAGNSPNLSLPISHAWLGGIAAKMIRLEFAEINQLNSILVAWLLQLGQSAKPATMELRGVNRQVATQLGQLRLNHMMVVHLADA